MKIRRLKDIFDPEIRQKGSWQLTKNHELEYISRGKEEEFQAKFPLIATEPDALVVAVTEKQSDQKIVTNLHKISGVWSMDAKNQIQFDVARESGSRNRLIFNGAWHVGDNHKIIYTYETEKLKTKSRDRHELVFDGFWELSEKNRLTYRLSSDSDSAFRIRGAFQTHSIFAKEGEIRYQAGMEVLGRSRVQTIVFFGKWIVSRDLSMGFELEGKGKRKKLSFESEWSLTPSSQVIVKIVNEKGDPLGLEVIFTKDILGKDMQLFARASKNSEETRAEAGMLGKW